MQNGTGCGRRRRCTRGSVHWATRAGHTTHSLSPVASDVGLLLKADTSEIFMAGSLYIGIRMISLYIGVVP